MIRDVYGIVKIPEAASKTMGDKECYFLLIFRMYENVYGL